MLLAALGTCIQTEGLPTGLQPSDRRLDKGRVVRASTTLFHVEDSLYQMCHNSYLARLSDTSRATYVLSHTLHAPSLGFSVEGPIGSLRKGTQSWGRWHRLSSVNVCPLPPRLGSCWHHQVGSGQRRVLHLDVRRELGGGRVPTLQGASEQSVCSFLSGPMSDLGTTGLAPLSYYQLSPGFHSQS